MSDNSFLGHSKKREENGELLKFLAEEAKKAEAPLNLMQMSKVFVKKRGSSRTAHAVYCQTRKLLLKVPKMENIDKETKVRMFFALRVPVNEEYLKELRKDAVVVIDGKKRITKYEANDGSLKLEGKEKGIPRDFQEEKDKENIEEGNRQVITKSRRVSKNNSTSNETKEEQMDFDGHDIPAQLQNEPVKIQNVGTSSKKKTIKRKANAQKPKSTKKSKKPSTEEGVKPEEEIVYEGPGEPPRPAVWLRKIEPFQEPIVLSEDEEKQENKKPDTLGLFGDLNNFKFEENVEVSAKDAVDSFTTELSTPNSTIKSMKASLEGRAEPKEKVVYEGPRESPLSVQLPKKREPVEETIALLDVEEHPKEKKPATLGFFGNSGNLKLEEDVDFGVSPEDAVDSFSAALSESSSMNVSQPSSDFTNITKFLDLLRSLVGTLESSKLCGLHEKIHLKIKKLGDKNLKAPTKHIRLALEASILFVTKNATSEYLEEDSISLKEYLHYFKALTYNLTSPEFADFQKALRDAINQRGNQDKRIPYEEIQYGLEHAIKLVLP